MARPNKIGLDYFPLDVDFFEDEKILAISGEFAVKGEVIALRLLCEIYRNGYFVEYSGLLKNKLARLGGISAGLVDEVVSKLVKYGFFDGSLFREQNILTSKGIQKRFAEAAKRRKNDPCLPYWLLSGVNAYINHSSAGVNVNINAESKVNESKVKERDPPLPRAQQELPFSEQPPPAVPAVPAAAAAAAPPPGGAYTGAPPREAFFPLAVLADELLGDQAWLDSVYMQYRVNQDEVGRYMREFCGEIALKGEEQKSRRDFKHHFVSWLKLKIDKQKPTKNYELRKTFSKNYRDFGGTI